MHVPEGVRRGVGVVVYEWYILHFQADFELLQWDKHLSENITKY